MIGSTLDGKYQIVRLLGEGGMGAVYEATHVSTRKRVAVKVITGDIGKHASLVQRFQREAKAAGAIDTQHIAQVLDTGTDPASEAPYMVMEYLAGEDLQQLLRRVSQIPPDLALRIVAQACLALDKAHAARVVHRDVKPANLYLSEKDGGEIIVKILDFGIAKIKQDQAVSAETAGLTRTGSMLGSPLYMSPEQARGHKTIDHRADIWSLGIVLYQSLAGHTPYDDIDALGELIIAICSEPPRNVQELAPWVPPEVAAIVHRALRFDPNERYQSAAEMHADAVALLPDGYGIQKSMLLPVTAEMKAQHAPKYELSNVGMVRAATLPTHAIPSASQPPPSGSDGGAANGAATNQGVTRSDVGAAPRRASTAALLGTFAVVALVGGFGVYKLAANDSANMPPAPAQQPVAATPPPAPTTSAPSVAPTPDKTVKLVLLPADTSAEVDGSPVESKDGIIEVTGALGSVHKVRVFKGKNETIGEIVVTEHGAMPPKLELAPPSAGATAKPKLGPVATAVATVKPAAPPTAAPKGIDTKFE